MKSSYYFMLKFGVSYKKLVVSCTKLMLSCIKLRVIANR